ncbi:restriction endonuclease subunit M [Campylobacter ureolyticus]|uniref:restriction endonuclease subunit M n=1 Tax=Campylobacter ureolyticus TaxID=827 RepID=UPI0022B595FD|nr:N-6 DNA methylase [Campylobacter ureolyticus]MCZ6132302.1 N-6 DNA methylase [Campylobacter ureolyticus]
MADLKKYYSDFDTKYKNLKTIDSDFYEKEIGVVSYNKKANTKDINGCYSEEYIRARFIYSLVFSGLYPKENICVEFGFPKGNTKKTLNPDIVVFKNKEWLDEFKEAKKTSNFAKIRQNLLVIFEAKQNNKTIEDAVENQLRSAMNENESRDKVFGVYFDIEDGILIFKKFGNSPIRRFDESLEKSGNGMVLLNFDRRDLLSDLPSFQDFKNNNESVSNLEKLTIDSLEAIDEINFSSFMSLLQRDADRVKPKHEARDLIVEFLTLKVFDEKRSKKNKTNLKFYIKPEEITKSGGLGASTFRKRIQELYRDAKIEYPKVLLDPYFKYDSDGRPSSANEERFLIALVQSFQKRAILKSKNESFNQIIFNNFGSEKQKADKGQFFTPIPVVKTIIKMLNPIEGEDVCDPCCGIADFLAMAFKHAYRKDEEYPPSISNYFGFDIEKNNLKLAELNLVLNGDGGATLKEMDSLFQKLMINGVDVLNYADFNDKFYDSCWNHKENAEKDLKKFKIIATNPPFGKGRALKITNENMPTMKLYETYRIRASLDKKGNIKLPNEMDPGVLFLENAYRLLEDGGRMAIVLSNSIASIKEWENVRKWFLDRMRIVALFDLPANTFGETGAATTVIIAYKPKEKNPLKKDYEVFVKEIENIGYEVKTVQRAIHFEPQFIINEKTFEKTSNLEEDFTKTIAEFKEYLKRQEAEIKEAFHLREFE